MKITITGGSFWDRETSPIELASNPVGHPLDKLAQYFVVSHAHDLALRRQACLQSDAPGDAHTPSLTGTRSAGYEAARFELKLSNAKRAYNPTAPRRRGLVVTNSASSLTTIFRQSLVPVRRTNMADKNQTTNGPLYIMVMAMITVTAIVAMEQHPQDTIRIVLIVGALAALIIGGTKAATAFLKRL